MVAYSQWWLRTVSHRDCCLTVSHSAGCLLYLKVTIMVAYSISQGCLPTVSQNDGCPLYLTVMVAYCISQWCLLKVSHDDGCQLYLTVKVTNCISQWYLPSITHSEGYQLYLTVKVVYCISPEKWVAPCSAPDKKIYFTFYFLLGGFLGEQGNRISGFDGP